MLAQSTHRCEAASTIIAGAQTGAAMFASTYEAIHVRLVMPPDLATDGWIMLLQEHTASHDLVHHVFDIDQVMDNYDGPRFNVVISCRLGYKPDLRQILHHVATEMRRST